MNVAQIIGLVVIAIIFVILVTLSIIFYLKRGKRIIKFLGIINNEDEAEFDLDKVSCFLAIILAVNSLALLIPILAVLLELFELIYLFAIIVIISVIVSTILFGGDYLHKKY